VRGEEGVSFFSLSYSMRNQKVKRRKRRFFIIVIHLKSSLLKEEEANKTQLETISPFFFKEKEKAKERKSKRILIQIYFHVPRNMESARCVQE
jgi:hypothetical protein